MKGTTRRTILLVLAGIAVGSMCTRCTGKQFERARLISEASAQSALFVEAKHLLADHKAKHGSYPDSLANLPFTYPDGGTAKTLESIMYSRCDGGYIIGHTRIYDRRTIIEKVAE